MEHDLRRADRCLLVVLADEIDEDALDAELAERVPPGVAVRLIASPELPWLSWLTNQEDDARNRAEQLALHAAAHLGQAQVVEAGVGDASPRRLAEDAASLGRADEVLIVFGDSQHHTPDRDEVMRDVELRLGVPVRAVHLPGPPPRTASGPTLGPTPGKDEEEAR